MSFIGFRNLSRKQAGALAGAAMAGFATMPDTARAEIQTDMPATIVAAPFVTLATPFVGIAGAVTHITHPIEGFKDSAGRFWGKNMPVKYQTAPAADDEIATPESLRVVPVTVSPLPAPANAKAKVPGKKTVAKPKFSAPIKPVNPKPAVIKATVKPTGPTGDTLAGAGADDHIVLSDLGPTYPAPANAVGALSPVVTLFGAPNIADLQNMVMMDAGRQAAMQAQIDRGAAALKQANGERDAAADRATKAETRANDAETRAAGAEISATHWFWGMVGGIAVGLAGLAANFVPGFAGLAGAFGFGRNAALGAAPISRYTVEPTLGDQPHSIMQSQEEKDALAWLLSIDPTLAAKTDMVARADALVQTIKDEVKEDKTKTLRDDDFLEMTGLSVKNTGKTNIYIHNKHLTITKDATPHDIIAAARFLWKLTDIHMKKTGVPYNDQIIHVDNAEQLKMLEAAVRNQEREAAKETSRQLGLNASLTGTMNMDGNGNGSYQFNDSPLWENKKAARTEAAKPAALALPAPANDINPLATVETGAKASANTHHLYITDNKGRATDLGEIVSAYPKILPNGEENRFVMVRQGLQQFEYNVSKLNDLAQHFDMTTVEAAPDLASALYTRGEVQANLFRLLSATRTIIMPNAAPKAEAAPNNDKPEGFKPAEAGKKPAAAVDAEPIIVKPEPAAKGEPIFDMVVVDADDKRVVNLGAKIPSEVGKLYVRSPTGKQFAYDMKKLVAILKKKGFTLLAREQGGGELEKSPQADANLLRSARATVGAEDRIAPPDSGDKDGASLPVIDAVAEVPAAEPGIATDADAKKSEQNLPRSLALSKLAAETKAAVQPVTAPPVVEPAADPEEAKLDEFARKLEAMAANLAPKSKAQGADLKPVENSAAAMVLAVPGASAQSLNNAQKVEIMHLGVGKRQTSIGLEEKYKLLYGAESETRYFVPENVKHDARNPARDAVFVMRPSGTEIIDESHLNDAIKSHVLVFGGFTVEKASAQFKAMVEQRVQKMLAEGQLFKTENYTRTAPLTELIVNGKRITADGIAPVAKETVTRDMTSVGTKGGSYANSEKVAALNP